MMAIHKYLFGAFSLCFTIQGVSSQWAVDDDGCRTPDNGSGTCIPLKQCQGMVDLIRSLERPIPSSTQKKINAYTCGTENGGIKVCCPPGPIKLSLDVNTSPRFHERLEPPDVTNHKNINLLPETCGLFDSSKRIVGGTNAALNEFPWMALLQYQKLNNSQLEFLCGGTIISKNYILTAAHCVVDLGIKILVSVRVGEYSIKNETDCELQPNKKLKCNPPVQNLDIEKIIPHPQYGGKTGGFVNDIALIRVSTINLNIENARPVCLPIGVVRDFPYKSVIVTGWGVTNISSPRESADILQKVGLPVIDEKACANIYKEIGISLTKTHTCIGGMDKDSCGGDSGGPMMVPTPLVGDGVIIIYVQQGIVSFGHKSCGTTKFPGIYTVVKYYMDWILDNMEK